MANVCYCRDLSYPITMINYLSFKQIWWTGSMQAGLSGKKRSLMELRIRLKHLSVYLQGRTLEKCWFGLLRNNPCAAFGLQNMPHNPDCTRLGYSKRKAAYSTQNAEWVNKPLSGLAYRKAYYGSSIFRLSYRPNLSEI